MIASTNSKLKSSRRRLRRKDSLDTTEYLSEVTLGKAPSSVVETTSSTSDQIRKDMIKKMLGSVSSSKETRSVATRSKRKNSCDSETEETTVSSIKLRSKKEDDKRRQADSSTRNEEIVDKSKKSAETLDSNIDKTGVKSKTRSTERQTKTKQGKDVAVLISEVSTESKLGKGKSRHRSETESKSCSKVDAKSSNRKRKGSLTDQQYNNNNNNEGKSSTLDIELEAKPVSIPSADDKDTKVTVRVARRITRKTSRESEPENASLDSTSSSRKRRTTSCDSDEAELTEKPTAKKRTKKFGDLETIPEADEDRIDAPTSPLIVPRNKTKNESSGCQTSEKVPKMDEQADLDDFCASVSKVTKSNSGKKTSAVSAAVAASETSTSRSTRKGKKAAVVSEDATCSGSRSETPTTPRKATSDLRLT
nr:unnamed protein product [Callosobruchus analis]